MIFQKANNHLCLAGLRCTGERLLSSNEILELQNQSSKARLLAWLLAVLFLPLVLVIMGVGTILTLDYAPEESSIAVFFILLILLIPAFALLQASDYHEQSKNQILTLCENKVLRFEGCVADLSDSRIVAEAISTTRCIAEDMPSGEILTVCGRQPKPKLQCVIEDSALIEELNFAQSLAVPLHDSWRQLSFGEIEGIQCFSWRQTWKNSRFGMASSLFLLFCLVTVLWSGSKLHLKWSGIPFVLAWMFSVCVAIKNAFDMCKLRQDANNGFVQKMSYADGSYAETLPLSDNLWTFNGKPASRRSVLEKTP